MFHFKKEEQNLYTILQVKTNSNSKEIKLAYYKMAKKYHPDFMFNDKFTDYQRAEADEMFKKIQKAFETLGNPIAR
jgi:DnaJ-class molecular chaperone